MYATLNFCCFKFSYRWLGHLVGPGWQWDTPDGHSEVNSARQEVSTIANRGPNLATGGFKCWPWVSMGGGVREAAIEAGRGLRLTKVRGHRRAQCGAR